MKPDKIHLSIDELYLHGFAPADRFRIGEALRVEMTRLFNEQGIPSGLTAQSSTAFLDGGSFEVTPASRPELIGTQIAHMMYSKLQQE